MHQLDTWIGDVLNEVDDLRIADNTIIVIMEYNELLEQALGSSGFTHMLYRGYKGQTTEGAVRVSAFIKYQTL